MPLYNSVCRLSISVICVCVFVYLRWIHSIFKLSEMNISVKFNESFCKSIYSILISFSNCLKQILFRHFKLFFYLKHQNFFILKQQQKENFNFICWNLKKIYTFISEISFKKFLYSFILSETDKYFYF